MRAELPPLHSVRAGIQQRRARLTPEPSHIDPEPGDHHPVARDQDRNGLGWRDIRVEREIDAGASCDLSKIAGTSPDSRSATGKSAGCTIISTRLS
jgi:hypothetical protein